MPSLIDQFKERALAEISPEYRKKRQRVQDTLESTLHDLGGEEASIDPVFQDLRDQLTKLYGQKRSQADLELTRRGLFNSSIAPQTFNLFSQEEGQQVGALASEKATKLARIAERRTIAQQRAQSESSGIESDFESELRNRIFKLQDEQEKRDLDVAKITGGRVTVGGRTYNLPGRKTAATTSQEDIDQYAASYLDGDIDITAVPQNIRAKVLARAAEFNNDLETDTGTNDLETDTPATPAAPSGPSLVDRFGGLVGGLLGKFTAGLNAASQPRKKR